ncbi:sulfite exporter TauE/SafE family protein [Agrobacterium vitis]|uniref:sulfite exporter TauE/SafE family protein n=1 Tax=Rhizobium/Agrobacterium group TaxID=227290 RepID=UPI0012E81817|nr:MULTISPECIES: sulfite exporter TauE/SafE family protein [Rhizobium/Agrobacterium group]MCF1462892.1 sulfite exporter TauE/SafE family protein [Allorhizobium ampelinum]MCF1470514.1 sulfite exporter TauE/SafE family protein [Allorhizobium ampelinum]MCF1493059.1 sulfite exporter TauE/SafE family protein [Allorhizobium ampelinum]MVA44820.1 TSUP family transporter [Agrobacterium vitis]
MLPDLSFLLAAIPAVVLVGLSKGGLGGAFSLLGVPILALAVPPMTAAAIFLPILLVMDLVALHAWRHHGDWRTFFLLLPGAIAGIAFGWATSALIPADAMRLVLGAITVVFAGRYFLRRLRGEGHDARPAKPQRAVAATGWGTLAGYGSFVAHAGGPPFEIYALPLKLDPKTYTGTSVRFFACLNAIKVIPYIALGQLDFSNFTLSLSLLPVALLSTMAGAMVVRRMKAQTFYPLIYAMTLIAGLKLFWDGLFFL